MAFDNDLNEWKVKKDANFESMFSCSKFNKNG